MPDDPVAYHMNEVEAFLPTWKKPALIMFGDSDPITRGQDKGGKISECTYFQNNQSLNKITNPKPSLSSLLLNFLLVSLIW